MGERPLALRLRSSAVGVGARSLEPLSGSRGQVSSASVATTEADMGGWGNHPKYGGPALGKHATIPDEKHHFASRVPNRLAGLTAAAKNRYTQDL